MWLWLPGWQSISLSSTELVDENVPVEQIVGGLEEEMMGTPQQEPGVSITVHPARSMDPDQRQHRYKA